IARSEATKQSRSLHKLLDCFASLAMTKRVWPGLLRRFVLLRSLNNNAAGEQRRDPFRWNPPVGEGGPRALSQFPRRRWAARRCPAKARRRRRLHHAFDFDERLARNIVRMMRRFGHGENRREAGVGALQELAPFVSAAGLENLLELGAQLRSVVGGVGQ